MKQTFKENPIIDNLEIEAKSYAVIEQKSAKLLLNYKGKKQREMASLTKIMTFYAILQYVQKYGFDIKTEFIKIGKTSANMIGTSAKLKYGDTLSVYDMLFALMLPSGNDAAYALAEYFGGLLYLKQNQRYVNSMKEKDKSDDHILKSVLGQNSVKVFICQMNIHAKQLGLKNTQYSNSHGLMNKFNKSTCIDQARLCYICMQDQLFRLIVSTKQHVCDIKKKSGKIKQKQWNNTNKLLDKPECIGIKTGQTISAGPCLASSFKINNTEIIIVIFNTESLEDRFTESWEIFKFIKEKINSLDLLQSPQNKQKQQQINDQLNETSDEKYLNTIE